MTLTTACQSQCRYAQCMQPGQCCMDVDPVVQAGPIRTHRPDGYDVFKPIWRAPGQGSLQNHMAPADPAFLRLARAM